MSGDPRILDLVIEDLHARDAKGRETYGSSLRASSTNDALQFAYEEALDAAMYLRQEIERRKAGAESLARTEGRREVIAAVKKWADDDNDNRWIDTVIEDLRREFLGEEPGKDGSS